MVPLPHVNATQAVRITTTAFALIQLFPPPQKEWEQGLR